jgi:hypothetical protein
VNETPLSENELQGRQIEQRNSGGKTMVACALLLIPFAIMIVAAANGVEIPLNPVAFWK